MSSNIPNKYNPFYHVFNFSDYYFLNVGDNFSNGGKYYHVANEDFNFLLMIYLLMI